jgi:hypothetical protein
MDKLNITSNLNLQHQSFTDYLSSLSKSEFEFNSETKWSAGQQLEHIRLCLKPLNMILSVPKVLTRLYFGRANRDSKSYLELVSKYQSKLGNRGVAPPSFSPEPIKYDQLVSLSNTVLRIVNRIIEKVQNFSERELDAMILPHPVLGKVTKREMLYFTIYHVNHHKDLTEKNLKNFKKD